MAPYGQEEIPELKSVFEWPHLKENAVFLDTQCTSVLPSEVEFLVDHSSLADRMPTVIGKFISRHVYDSELRTQHAIESLTCCRFVDVSNGKEAKEGVSWVVRILSIPQIRCLR